MSKSQATAAPWPLKLGRFSLEMRPMREADVGALDNWVRGRYVDAIRKTLGGLSAEERRESLSIAFDKAAKMFAFDAEGSRLLATPEGLAKLVQVCCRVDEKEVPHDELYRLLFDPENAEFVRQAFSHLNPVGNARGRRKSPANNSAKRKSTPRS